MVSLANPIHFVLFPLMAQGHMIPMVDIARLLARRGMMVTIVTTPTNAVRFETVLSRAIASGLRIQLLLYQFPCEEAGLPEGCENFDMLPLSDLAINLFTALPLLQRPAEELFETLTPKPNCIVSDMCFPWTVHIANKYNIPRISFHGFSCFCLLCLHCIRVSKVLENIASESEYFPVPCISEKVEITKVQLPETLYQYKEFGEVMLKAELMSHGSILNTFEELEQAYVEDYTNIREDKLWCIGPVSLCNEERLDKAERGNKASIDEEQCMKWLNLQQPNSVIYACLGSLCNLIPTQLMELAFGLEESNRPFIWVMRGGSRQEELEKWIKDDGFEERIKDRGLLIRGWAPQVLILSHPSIGGFLTHCGWNSTLEGISAGVPLITWPLFADQFLNEKLAVQILKIGVSIGVKYPMKWGEEEKIGLVAKKEDIKGAIDKLMDEGEGYEVRRKKARELGGMAKKAVEEGGSSYHNVTLFIQHIAQHSLERKELDA